MDASPKLFATSLAIRVTHDTSTSMDYQTGTTIPCKGEKLSDERLMGMFSDTPADVAGLVSPVRL